MKRADTMTPQEVEQYVILASDASDPQRQQQANAFLHHWTNSASADEQMLTIIQLIQNTNQQIVAFFSLTAFLQKLTQTTPAHRTTLRQALLQKILQQESEKINRVAAISNASNHSAASAASVADGNSCWDPAFVRTKIGVVLARCAEIDFPDSWPTAFSDLQDEAGILRLAPDIFLRTLIALTDDVGHEESEITTKIKDHLRGFASSDSKPVSPDDVSVLVPTQQSISARLVSTVVSILSRSMEQVTNCSTGASHGPSSSIFQLYILCLTVLKGFCSWLDFTLLMQDRVLRIMFAALAHGSTTESPTADAAVLVMEFFEELVARGMEDQQKVDMLKHMDILSRIHNCIDLNTVDASPIDVVMEVAKFLNRTGIEMISMAESSTKSNDFSTLWSQILSLFFQCFAYDDIDISGAVLPLATALVHPQNIRNAATDTISQLLTIMYRQMRYPPDFEFDYEDDIDAEEEMYRSELRKLYQALLRVAPEGCMQFTRHMLSQLPVPISMAPTSDLEASLRLVYHYCEGIRPPPGMKVVMRNESFVSLIVALHTSDITHHPHREILTLYYETAVRYFPIFKDRVDLLQAVFDALTGSRGLQHVHSRVRSRCCYLLLRLVKQMAGSGAGGDVLRPYVETAVLGIQGLLESNRTLPSLRSEDKLYLFETIGLLLGKTGLEPLKQKEYLTQVMTPHVQSIQNILDQPQSIAQDPEYYGGLLSESIAAIAFLSKGFKSPGQEVQEVLLTTVRVALAVLETLPSIGDVRNKTLVLIQRMIQCLNGGILPFMPRFLQPLIRNCVASDAIDVAQLLNQLCIKFKADSVPAIDASLLPFLRKCHTFMTVLLSEHQISVENAPPHLRVEHVAIQKLIYTVLQHIVVHRATPLLFSATNLPSLEDILKSMSDGAMLGEDPSIRKVCLNFFRELLDQWSQTGTGNDNANGEEPTISDPIVQGFVQFLSSTLIPGTMRSFLAPTFQIQDAMQWRCVLELSQILYILKTQQRVPNAYSQLVLSRLKEMGFAGSSLEKFQAASSAKELEVCLKTWVLSSQSATR